MKSKKYIEQYALRNLAQKPQERYRLVKLANKKAEQLSSKEFIDYIDSVINRLVVKSKYDLSPAEKEFLRIYATNDHVAGM